MGHIKEPKGVDFIIKSEPLTDKERSAISAFIKDYKEKHTPRGTKTTNRSRESNPRKKTYA